MDINEPKLFKNPPKSYWMDSTPQSAYPVLAEDIKVDIAIVGGGIAGLNTAYLLSQQGVKVAIIEADHILQGTTGHTTAKITSQHGLIYHQIKKQRGEELAKQYAEANETAIRMYEKIARENQIDCDLVPEAAYVYTQQAGYVEQIREEAEVAASLGIKASYLEQIPLGFPIKAAVRFADQAQFHPRKFLIPLAEKITNQGSQIFEQSRVVEIVEAAKGYAIITGQGKTVTAEKVVIASHYPFLNKPDFYFSRIYQERSYVVAIKAQEKYPGGMYINAEDPGRSLRNHPSEQGELIFVGGENHKPGQGEDTTLHYEALIDFANENFTVEDILYRWSTQDCMTLDNLPYVGHFTTETPNLYVATGYGKWGMTNSMASAILLTDLILKGRSPWQEVYAPSRQSTAVSIVTFISQNANVAKELIEGKIMPPAKNLEIKPGDARIVEKDGQKTGAYRDEQGEIHCVDTTCTHMGCEVQWNSAERSWDCPCHGSRFNIAGEVIEGPAVTSLKSHYNLNPVEKLLTEDF